MNEFQESAQQTRGACTPHHSWSQSAWPTEQQFSLPEERIHVANMNDSPYQER